MPTYYSNRSGYGRLQFFPPAIKWLLITNVAIFILEHLVLPALPGTTETFRTMGGSVELPLMRVLGALWPIGSGLFRPWQYLTYMFMHGDFMHIFFNLLGLWMFGVELEQLWGTRRFLAYYFICGLGAGIIHSIVTLLMGGGGPTVGASGAIMGVLLAFGLTFPDRIILMWFIPMPAKYAVLILAAIDLFNGVAGSSDGIAHFAHLGGALVGFLLLRFGGKMTLGGVFDRIPFLRKKDEPRVHVYQPPAPQRPSPRQPVDVRHRDVQGSQPRRDAHPTMEFGSDQARVDAILDKLSKHGYTSLSDEEKSFLVEASKRMR